MVLGILKLCFFYKMCEPPMWYVHFIVFNNSCKIYANLNMVFLKFSTKVLAELQWKLNIFVLKSREVVINYTLINYLNYKYLHKNEITIFFILKSRPSNTNWKVFTSMFIWVRDNVAEIILSRTTPSNIFIQGTIGILKTVHPMVYIKKWCVVFGIKFGKDRLTNKEN